MTKRIRRVEADVFTAIAHPVRRRILETLARGGMTANALAKPFDISRSAVSQHLSILLESGLVTATRKGREHVYQLRPDNLNQVYEWISQYERFWTHKLDALSLYLDNMTEEEQTPPDET
ncbi:MAG: winged helix-turn-helix transcriptional regulator [Chloroflexi bacterium]|nr:winged helix-turn-helix transcriptional regulator [Chloroflexota bacterium]